MSLPLPQPPAWRARAMCRGLDPAIFVNDQTDEATVELAKSICDGCPVQGECRESVMTGPFKLDAIYGGLTPLEQRRERRRRQRADRKQSLRVAQ